MSKFPRTFSTKWALAAAFGMMILPGARGGNAYLPRIGPSPIRLAIAKPTRSHAVEIFASPVEIKKPVAPLIEPVVTNEVKEVADAGPIENPPPETNMTAVVEPLPIEHAPADNLLSITPTMLTEYFTPVAGATNRASVLVVQPVEMGFTPPIPKETPSSRATYISE